MALTFTAQPRDPKRAHRDYVAQLPEPVEAEDGTATAVMVWYDSHLRLWTVYLIDEAGQQVDGASYDSSREQAQREGEYLWHRAQLGRTGAPR